MSQFSRKPGQIFLSKLGGKLPLSILSKLGGKLPLSMAAWTIIYICIYLYYINQPTYLPTTFESSFLCSKAQQLINNEHHHSSQAMPTGATRGMEQRKGRRK